MTEPKPKIILIEDDEVIKIAIKEYLACNGFDIVIPKSLNELKECFDEWDASCLITDIIMPDTDGIEFIVAVRNLCPDIIIIAVSGGGIVDGSEYLSLAEVLGANAVLQKPFLLSELLDLIKKLLKEKEK